MGSSASALAAPGGHHGDELVRVEAWPSQVEALGLDVWTHRTAVPSVLARVTPQGHAALDASGLAYVVVEPDLGPRVEAERARLLTAPPVLGGGLDPAYHQDFRDLATILDRLDALVAAQAGRVSLVEVGESVEGRPIRGVRITNPGPADRPVVLVQATQHAREWIAAAASVFAAEQLATAPLGGELDGLLDQVEVVVVPVANPDGYVYSWQQDRFWRKNRGGELGVDLNRNWSVAWGGDGASPNPEDDDYRGEGPFSEPETAALRDFVGADPDLVAVLDVHSYGQLVLYPWGFGYVDSADDALFGEIATDMVDAMWPLYNQTYEPLQSADLYPASGNAIDWAYGVHGLYAVTIELRPQYFEEWGFLLPPQFIVPTGEELLVTIEQLIEASIELGPGNPGDSGGEAMDTGSDGTTGGDGLDGTTSAASTGGSPPSTSGDPPPPGETGRPLPGGTGESGETGEPGANDDEAGVDSEGQGCGCREGQGRGGGWAWLWAVAAVGLRLRRRRAQRPC